MRKMPEKNYFCPWIGCPILAVAARNCNYLNSETYVCRHDDNSCVAKVGLEQFAQRLASSTEHSADELLLNHVVQAQSSPSIKDRQKSRKFLYSLLLAPVHDEWEHD
jgi:hypothetical protein